MTAWDRVVLIGPMGSGKSTIGRRVARRLDLPFIDLDDYIVFHAGRSISAIFREDGEECFRDLETAALRECLQKHAVIATGGGAPVREQNQELIRGSGLVIYLYAGVETQYQRTARDRGRPMIAVDDRRARLESIFAARDPIYRDLGMAVVLSETLSVEGCAHEIVHMFESGATAEAGTAGDHVPLKALQAFRHDF